jgi:hypothetical protein
LPCHLYHAQTFIGTAGYCSCHLASAAFCLKAALRKPSIVTRDGKPSEALIFPLTALLYLSVWVGVGRAGLLMRASVRWLVPTDNIRARQRPNQPPK